MIFEVFPHIAMILYRLYRSRARLLFIVFRTASLTIFIGTAGEQVAVGIFYFHIWKHWPLALKVEGIILHFCFMAAQIHGGRLCWQIARKMQSEARDGAAGKLSADVVQRDDNRYPRSENATPSGEGNPHLERRSRTSWTASPSVLCNHAIEDPKLESV